MKPATYALALLVIAGCGDGEGLVVDETSRALCSDGIDNDRDGRTDCADLDCTFFCREFNCVDGLDNDADGKTDCEDADCVGTKACACSGSVPSVFCDAPDGMIPVLGGTFEQGCLSRSESRPVHDVTVPTFYMDRTPITVEEYKLCIEAGACTAPPTYEDYGFCTWGPHPRLTAPIRCVTWAKARNFCEWREMRLCSESEWEYVFQRGAKDLGIESWAIGGFVGTEFVADCWVPNYGTEHPDGTLELSVPTDGSALTSGPCDRRVARTIASIERAWCFRGAVEPSKLYEDPFFRCCADVAPR